MSQTRRRGLAEGASVSLASEPAKVGLGPLGSGIVVESRVSQALGWELKGGRGGIASSSLWTLGPNSPGQWQFPVVDHPCATHQFRFRV